MKKNHALFFALFVAPGCAAPTLQQREANWYRYQDVTRATCMVGQADSAMPTDVRDWCVRAVGP